MNRWKYVERTCIVGGVLIALAALYFEAGNYYGWNKSQAPASALLATTSLAGGWAIMLAVIAVAMILTGWRMIYVRTRQPRTAKEPLNHAQHALILEMRKLVLSKLESAVEQCRSLYSNCRNIYDSTRGPSPMTDDQWLAMRELGDQAINERLGEQFVTLQKYFSQAPEEIDPIFAQREIKRFLQVYLGTKRLLFLFPKATGLDFHPQVLPTARAAEEQCYIALRDLAAFPAATEINQSFVQGIFRERL